jgi:hypothetical protein
MKGHRKNFFVPDDDDDTILIVGIKEIKLYVSKVLLKFTEHFKNLFNSGMIESKLQDRYYIIKLPDDNVDCVIYFLCNLYNIKNEIFNNKQYTREISKKTVVECINFCRNYIFFCDKYFINDSTFFKRLSVFIRDQLYYYDNRETIMKKYVNDFVNIFKLLDCLYLPITKESSFVQKKVYNVCYKIFSYGLPNTITYLNETVRDKHETLVNLINREEENYFILKIFRHLRPYKKIYYGLIDSMKSELIKSEISMNKIKKTFYMFSIFDNNKISISNDVTSAHLDVKTIKRIFNFCELNKFKINYETFTVMMLTSNNAFDMYNINSYGICQIKKEYIC